MSKKLFIRFFLIFLVCPIVLFAENKTALHFDLPKKDAKEQCSIVIELYKQTRKKTNNKFIVGNLYRPLNLFESNYRDNKVEVNEIVIMDGNRQPYSCLFYYKNKNIIGVDCASSNYDEDPAELKDLLSTSDVIRYKNDCIGYTNNDGKVTKKIKTNCFIKLDLGKNQPLENDILIKDCKAEFYQKN